MGELFETTPENVLMHLQNIYQDAELVEAATAKDFFVVRSEGTRQVRRTLKHYNLDAILSVGYRVSCKRAVQFRQWATRTLNQHLVRGYTLNRDRFEHNARELEAALELVRKAAASPELGSDTGRGLVEVISRYTQTFLWLQRYDEGLLDEPPGQPGGTLPSADEAMQALQHSRPNSSPAARPANSSPGPRRRPGRAGRRSAAGCFKTLWLRSEGGRIGAISPRPVTSEGAVGCPTRPSRFRAAFRPLFVPAERGLPGY